MNKIDDEPSSESESNKEESKSSEHEGMHSSGLHTDKSMEDDDDHISEENESKQS